MRFQRQLIWLILRLYPGEFQRRYSTEMLLTFEDAYRRDRRPLKALRFWTITLPDLLLNAVREHASLPGAFRRLMGLVGMVGGLLWAFLHTPLGLNWFAVPALSLIGLLAGLFAAYQAVGATRRTGALGFALAASGLGITFAGYVAAWYFDWRQSGLPTLFGAALQSAGQLLIAGAFSPRQPWARLSRLLFFVGLVNAAHTIWLLIFLHSAMLLEAPVALFGVILQGLLSGVAWAAVGYTLCMVSEQVPQIG